MELKTFLEKLKYMHETFLDYLDNKEDNKEELNGFFQNIINQKILEDKQLLKDFLYLISKISANYHRSPDLFSKIEQILFLIKSEITANFSNLEIFNIFDKSKKILLFLFDEKILLPDRSIYNIITDYKHTKKHYPDYFCLEFKDFIQNSTFPGNIEFFNEKRKIGENESNICQLIRNDSIDEFIFYINKNSISLHDYYIENSIFETNSFLTDKEITLIEYAAFFGSIQIFRYLRLNNIKLEPSLWIYAIHGKNAELFNFLEENKVEFNLEMKNQYLKESIKCHHNEFAEYLKSNFSSNIDQYENIVNEIKYHNLFSLLNDDSIEYSKLFFYFCKYDHFYIVKFLLDNYSNKIDLNMVQQTKTKIKKDGYETIITEWTNVMKYYSEKSTPLCAAIKKRNKEIVQLLLEQKGINVNVAFDDHYYFDCYGGGDEYKTPLFIAVENEDLQIVQLLLKQKFLSINYSSKYCKYSKELGDLLIMKQTPLHLAVEKQNIEIIKCLLKAKDIEINIIEKSELEHLEFFQKTALHIAIEKGNYEIVQLLLDNKINQSINYKHYSYCYVNDAPSYYEDIEINSPLKHAYKYSNYKIIGLLLKNKVCLIE